MRRVKVMTPDECQSCGNRWMRPVELWWGDLELLVGRDGPWVMFADWTKQYNVLKHIPTAQMHDMVIHFPQRLEDFQRQYDDDMPGAAMMGFVCERCGHLVPIDRTQPFKAIPGLRNYAAQCMQRHA